MIMAYPKILLAVDRVVLVVETESLSLNDDFDRPFAKLESSAMSLRIIEKNPRNFWGDYWSLNWNLVWERD